MDAVHQPLPEGIVKQIREDPTRHDSARFPGRLPMPAFSKVPSTQTV